MSGLDYISEMTVCLAVCFCVHFVEAEFTYPKEKTEHHLTL